MPLHCEHRRLAYLRVCMHVHMCELVLKNAFVPIKESNIIQQTGSRGTESNSTPSPPPHMSHPICRRTVTLRRDRFDEREADFYDALYTQSQAQFDAYVQTGTVVNNYAHIFDLLIRLRQVQSWHMHLVSCSGLGKESMCSWVCVVFVVSWAAV